MTEPPTLEQLAQLKEYRTDKNTTHSYLELYDQLFAIYQDRPINLLEIGNHNGGSLELWDDYFKQAQFYGLEINKLDTLAAIGERPNMNLHRGVDAYCHQSLGIFQRQDLTFDIVIDDGSHQPVHQVYVLNNWLPMVKPGGLLVIEDVLNIETAAAVVASATELSKDDRVAIFDRTNVKGQADDIVIVIKKGSE